MAHLPAALWCCSLRTLHRRPSWISCRRWYTRPVVHTAGGTHGPVHQPAIRERLRAINLEHESSISEAFARFFEAQLARFADMMKQTDYIRTERARWAAVVEKSGIRKRGVLR